MNVELVQRDGSLIHLRLSGRVSQRSLSEHSDPIETLVGKEAYGAKLLIDMAGAEYLDSSGVSWLLSLHKHCREAGGRLVLYGIPPIVLQVLRVLRLDAVLKLAETQADAYRQVGEAGEV